MARDLALPVLITAALTAVLGATSYKLLKPHVEKNNDLAILQTISPVFFSLVGALIIYRRILAVVQPISHRLATYFKFALQHREQLGYQHKVNMHLLPL